MKRLWKILVLGSVLIAFTLGFSTGMAAMRLTPSEQIAKIEYTTWVATCYINKVDCSNVPRPLVVYSDIPEKEKMWGYYQPGDPYVVVNNTIHGDPFSLTVIAHEYTHYLQFIQRRYADEETPLAVECATEREAHDVGYIVATALELKSDPRVATWADNKDKYGCKE